MSSSALGSQFRPAGPRFDGSGEYMHHAGTYAHLQPGDRVVGLGDSKVISVRHTNRYDNDTIDGKPGSDGFSASHITYERPTGERFTRRELSHQPPNNDLIFKRPGTKKA